MSTNPNSSDFSYKKYSLEQLEERIKLLEDANVEQTNALYECWNSLDARIDILIEKIRSIGDV